MGVWGPQPPAFSIRGEAPDFFKFFITYFVIFYPCNAAPASATL